MKYAYLVVMVMCGFLLFLAYYRNAKAPSTASDVQHAVSIEPTATTSEAALQETSAVRLSYPMPGSSISHTFTVKGHARGNWFFEASMPVSVYDKDGSVLWQGAAQAKGEWMTTELVPFEVAVTIPPAYFGNAVIVIAKDNPSGLPQNDASVATPVVVK